MKNKKLLTVAFTALSLCLVACGGGGGSKDTSSQSGDHIHSWGEWVETKPATCTEEGEQTRTCKECGQTDSKKINKKNHEYEDFTDATHVAKTANCSEEGVSYQKCKNCGDIKETKIAKTSHAFGEAVDQKAVDDANTPSKIANCANCGDAKISWAIKDYDKALSSTDLKPGTDGGLKFSNVFNASQPTGGADSGTAGSYAGYSVYVPCAAEKATLSFRAKTSSNAVPVFDAVENDRNPSYEWNGTAWVLATKRLHVKVNGVDYPLGADNYGIVNGVTQWFDFPCEFPLKKGVNTVTLECYGGYRPTMYDMALTFKDSSVRHNNLEDHDWKTATAPTQGATDVALKKYTCACDLTKLEFNAMDEKKTVTGSLKDGTKEGYMKLKSNGDSVSYTITLDKGFAGMLYQHGFMDNYSSNQGLSYFTVNNTNPNFVMTVNGKEVNMEAMRGVTYLDMLGENIDADKNSDVKYCQVGEVELVAGQNTIVYTRKGSYNFAIDTFAIIGEDSCSHVWGDDPAHPDVAPTCEANGTDYSKCSICGKTKSEPVSATGHHMVDVDPDETHKLETSTCVKHGVSGWKKCDNPGCDHWEPVEAPLGDHEFEGSTCKNCGGIKVVWGASTNLWSSNKQVKGGSDTFDVNVATAGNYKVLMALKVGSGGSGQKLSVRGFSFKINGGEDLAPTNNDKTAGELGLSEKEFLFGEITTLDMPAGNPVKLTVSFASSCDFRFTISGADAYFLLLKA